MIKVDTRSPVPIYDQIKEEFRGLIAKRILKPGDTVPPTKALAATLLVNPRTVVRAYREMQQEGLIHTRGGRTFITSDAHSLTAANREELRNRLTEALANTLSAGFKWKDIEAILQSAIAKYAPDFWNQLGREETLAEPVNLVKLLQRFQSEEDLRKGFEALCPYCREKIVQEEAVASCSECKTAHHEECWNESGHCSVFGCTGTTMLRD